jgi:hypothetical protein
MPDGHDPAMPQVTAVDDQFGTHRVRLLYRISRQVMAWLGLLARSAESKNMRKSSCSDTRSPCYAASSADRD